jgi:serine/threonine-protein kinase
MLQLTSSALPLFSTSVTSDGRRLILWENNPKTTQDIVTLDVSESSAAGTRRVEPLIHTSAAEVDGEISPDGRWLAYQSNESGQPEVFVRPFPGVDAARWQVSSGGTRPAWARNGQELFYLDGQGLLTSVPLRIAGSSFSAGNPVRLLTTKYYPGFTGLGIDLRGYDVSQDGQRFLMIKDAPVEQSPSSPPASIVLVLNWFEELKARLPVK